MSQEKKGMSGVKKALWGTGVLFVVGVVCFMLFAYYATYSEGVRSGIVIKVSRKGLLMKTREGELNVQTFGSQKTGESPVSETFVFSVHQRSEQVYKDLESVSLTGERVNLHYEEMFIRLPWRGDTKYFVTSVQRNQRAAEGLVPVELGGRMPHSDRGVVGTGP
jgi:hypothetical protein